jgi:hypothetical protein
MPEELNSVKTKREVRKRNVFGTFGTLLTPIAFCLHNWTFWAFIIPGLVCLSFCLFFQLKHLGSKKITARIWAMILLGVGLLGSLAYWSGREQKWPLPTTEKSKPHPSFIFSLTMADTPSAQITLTNDFLFTTNFGKSISTFADVLVPRQVGQTECILQLIVSNNSLSTDGEFAIALPSDWECVPGFGWQGVESDFSSEVMNLEGVAEMSQLQTWAYRFSEFLPGDSIKLPDIRISKMPKERMGRIISILAKTKESPPECLGFGLCFVTVSTNVPLFHKPFVVWAAPNSNGWVTIPPDQLEELQK